MVRLSRKLKWARVGRFQVRTCNTMAAEMDEQSDKEIASKKQRDQMLKLVAKGFYNELINYGVGQPEVIRVASQDRKSTRLNSSHRCISYAVFCLKKKRHIK